MFSRYNEHNVELRLRNSIGRIKIGRLNFTMDSIHLGYIKNDREYKF